MKIPTGKKENTYAIDLYRLVTHFCILFIFLFVLVISSNNKLNAQVILQSNIDSIYYSSIENKDKIKAVEQLIESQDTSRFTLELAYTYHRLGLLYNRSKLYQKAIDETLKAVCIRESIEHTNSRDLNNSLFNISVYLNKMDRRPEGEQYLKRILDNHSENRFNYKALHSLAILESEKGDYFKALQYLETLIQTIDKEKFEVELCRAHRKGIEIYAEMPNPEKFIQKILEHEKQLKSYGRSAKEMVNVNNNLGVIYSKNDDHEKAIESYLKALPIYNSFKDSINLGRLFNNLGAQYSALKRYDKAHFYFKQALIYANQKIRASVYDNQGFYLQTDDPEQKIKLYQKAINTILGQEDAVININTLPELSIIEKSQNRLNVLFFLIDKAIAWVDVYDKKRESSYLIHAKETLYLIDQLVSIIRLDSENKQSKLFWINRGVDIYVLAVKVCCLLGEPEEAFYFMEKNKSLLLLENLAKEQHLKTKFLDIPSLNESLVKHVSDQTSFVEYILNEKEGFGLFSSENGTHLFELSNVPVLITKMNQLKKMVKRPFTSKDEFDEFDELSYAVFSALFPFEEALSLLEEKRLIVVPDYELHNLPFELLVTKKNKGHFEKNYLINTTEISYLHSCSVFQQIDKKECNKENKMIGFVPTIFQNDTLSDLRLSEVEMKKIATFFPSHLMLRKQATKASFIESLDKYNIIHINSHAGYTKNSTPWLSFYDQKVRLKELTTYSNHSSLVILDACKSALGEQELGEGIMSLSRAFFYGGASSVIASQWQVNEKSSGAIFNAFYKNIKAGESKSEALHHAKLSYLESNQLAQLSPYYWASFTLTGDAGKVIIQPNGYWMKVIVGVFAFLLLPVLLRRVAMSKK